MKNSIGIFDSGVGGLTVVKEVCQYLPAENILYFGDVARVPYGSKTKDEILDIVREIIDWMITYDVKAVAMACNTSSALALDIVRKEYGIPVFGLIDPTARFIHSLSPAIKKVGVIATEATVKSHNYAKLIQGYSADIEVFEVGCPGLVEIIEAGEANTSRAYKAVSEFIEPLLAEEVDKIVLGCTHYPFVSSIIEELTGRDDILVNPAAYMVKEMRDTMGELGILNGFNPQPIRDFYVSAAPAQFINVGNKLIPDFLNPANVSLIGSFEKKYRAVS
jgi:glutamate racemase